MKKLVKVVAAIIENDQQEILCALRSPQMSIPNLWEFPGRKVEANEDIYSALKREIDEELGCKIETFNEVFNDNTHEYDTFIINLISIKCRVVEGTPTPSEHSKLIWLKRENLMYWYIPRINPCIWKLNNAKYSNISYKCKKSQNTQVVHKNLHIFGTLILSLLF